MGVLGQSTLLLNSFSSPKNIYRNQPYPQTHTVEPCQLKLPRKTKNCLGELVVNNWKIGSREIRSCSSFQGVWVNEFKLAGFFCTSVNCNSFPVVLRLCPSWWDCTAGIEFLNVCRWCRNLRCPGLFHRKSSQVYKVQWFSLPGNSELCHWHL